MVGLTSAALTIAFHGGTNGRGRLKRSPARLTGDKPICGKFQRIMRAAAGSRNLPATTCHRNPGRYAVTNSLLALHPALGTRSPPG